LKRQDDLPWICAGDFNEVLHQDEQIGGNPRNEAQMLAFRECLMKCELTDLGYKGYSFTWNNKREGEANMQVRLDMGVVMASFLGLFPDVQAEHVVTEESDHMALVIRTLATAPRRQPGQHRGFMFEEMWMKHEGYESMIQEAWDSNPSVDSGIAGFWHKLRAMSRDMKRWSFDTFGSVQAELKALRGKLEAAKIEQLVSGSAAEVKEIEKKLHDLYEKEEIMYMQRSRQEWLKAGGLKYQILPEKSVSQETQEYG
jgi:hypothetical protein